MEIPDDFRERLAWFNDRGVEFVIVGGYALAFHGVPRFTGDLDLSLEDLTAPDRVIQLGVPPVRVDLLTSIDGVTWDEAWQGRGSGRYGDVPVAFPGRREFILNKRASGRLKDLADVEALGEEA